VVQAFLIDQLNLCVADFIIGARPVLGGGGRGSVGTANGVLSKVVNEGDILKELVPMGKQTRRLMHENHQMRDILVTLVMSAAGRRADQVEIKGKRAFRKRETAAVLHGVR
jgi:hypothetical protein